VSPLIPSWIKLTHKRYLIWSFDKSIQHMCGSHVSWLNILISMQTFMWSSIEIYGIEWDHSSMEWKHNIFSQFIFCLLILLTWLLFFRNETHCRRMPCHVTWHTLIELQAIHQKDWEESKRTERSSSFWLDYNRISLNPNWVNQFQWM